VVYLIKLESKIRESEHSGMVFHFPHAHVFAKSNWPSKSYHLFYIRECFSQEMNRLWNLSKSNLEACKSLDRSFMPSLEQYMAEAISQMDPASGIEPEYKRVNDPNFGWRALRLFSQKSTCFFSQNNNGKLITKLPEYLEYCLKSINKGQNQVTEEIDLKVS